MCIVALLVLSAAVPLALASTTASSKPTVKMVITVKSQDGFPVPGALVRFSYTFLNTTPAKPVNATKSIGPAATNFKGIVNESLTLDVNQSIVAEFNVTYDSAMVLTDYRLTVGPTTPAHVHLTVSVVNASYSVRSPTGSLLTDSKISFLGEPKSSTASVNVTRNAASGNILIPVGEYTVEAFRQGALFYTQPYNFSVSSKTVNVTASLLTLRFSVDSLTKSPLYADNVVLLSSNTILNTSAGSTGQFTGLLPGAYELVAYGDGSVNRTGVSLGTSETVVVQLPVGYSLQLTLLGALGSPLSGYTVSLAGPVDVNTTTNSKGEAQLQNLPLGGYTLLVYHEGKLVNATVVYLRASTQLTLNLQNIVKSNVTLSSVYAEIRAAIGVVLLLVAGILVLATFRAKKKNQSQKH